MDKAIAGHRRSRWIGMLLYIWIRFQLQWGFAAVVALAHDTADHPRPVLAVRQGDEPAGRRRLPDLVGYSVNDTVVVFDRIRENLRSKRGPQGLSRGHG